MFSTVVGIANASAGVCNDTPQDVQSMKDWWARQLRLNDPTHADHLIKIAFEVIDGRLDELKTDIAGGLSPDAHLPGAVGNTSLLQLSVAACQPAIARHLVLSGVSANGDGEDAPLVLAASKGEGGLVEFLIEHGASLEKVDFNGHTALEEAVRQHFPTAVRILVSHGADVNHRVGANANILDLVGDSNKPDDVNIANELRSHGAVSGSASIDNTK